jgi:hypothetical protein
MIRRVLSLSVLAAIALAACTQQQPVAPSGPLGTVAPPPPPPPANYQMYLYHGVRVLAGTNNVDWSNVSFGVSAGAGAPPGTVPNLSFFDSMNPVFPPPLPPFQAPPCWIRIQVTVPVAPPAPPPVNTVATWAAPPNPAAVAGAQPGPWNVTFDDNPPGHWNISKWQIAVPPVPPATVSNAAAGTIAGTVFHNAQGAGHVAVLPGTNPHCQP